ncbi:NIPSNAP family protein [Mesorhizobium sp. M0244]|uniref:NIPSNAP family protein n=1 Tax=Mesorhizobium sp. M0244 TaxID=2956926 RepID=UPI00333B2118
MAIQEEILGGFVGYFVCDIGELDHVAAFLALRNIGEREEERARMLAHPGWEGSLDSIKGMIDRQSIRILKPQYRGCSDERGLASSHRSYSRTPQTGVISRC